jgi:hypothetical protein
MPRPSGFVIMAMSSEKSKFGIVHQLAIRPQSLYQAQAYLIHTDCGIEMAAKVLHDKCLFYVEDTASPTPFHCAIHLVFLDV